MPAGVLLHNYVFDQRVSTKSFREGLLTQELFDPRDVLEEGGLLIVQVLGWFSPLRKDKPLHGKPATTAMASASAFLASSTNYFAHLAPRCFTSRNNFSLMRFLEAS